MIRLKSCTISFARGEGTLTKVLPGVAVFTATPGFVVKPLSRLNIGSRLAVGDDAFLLTAEVDHALRSEFHSKSTNDLFSHYKLRQHPESLTDFSGYTHDPVAQVKIV
ncbi:MAG: hypothetical protein R3C17_06710 [Planctomycetaceae bacterium]